MLKSLFLLTTSIYATNLLLLIPILLLQVTSIAHSLKRHNHNHQHHHHQHHHLDHRHHHEKIDEISHKTRGRGIETVEQQQQQQHHQHHQHHRGCGTEDPTDEEILETEQVMRRYLEKNHYRVGKKDIKSWEIKVYWHMITTRTDTTVEGILSQKDIDESIQVLNEAYKPYFTFKLVHTMKYEYNLWFTTRHGEVAEKEMKNALREGSSETLNIYSNRPAKKVLGWATFPIVYAKDPKEDGVVISYSTVPGGSELGYNEGMTLVHEVGHWLGLYHTFQGGCSSRNGDYVADTPPVAEANYNCSKVVDSCPDDEQKDMLNNFMDYTEDSCMNSFTQGQFDRMLAQWEVYRWSGVAKPRTISPTKNPTKSPIKSPTANPTESPIKSPITNPTADCVMLKVSIYTDNFPEDISWKVIDLNNNDRIVMSKSDYNRNDNDNLFNESKCVDSTLCLRFEISDAYEDGLCCANGEGYYVVTYKEETIMENKNFDSSFESSTDFGFGCSKSSSTSLPTISSTNLTCQSVGTYNFIKKIFCKGRANSKLNYFARQWEIKAGNPNKNICLSGICRKHDCCQVGPKRSCSNTGNAGLVKDGFTQQMCGGRILKGPTILQNTPCTGGTSGNICLKTNCCEKKRNK